MNIDDQINELFRAADSGFAERPSGRAWQQLESRLDARKQGRDRERSRTKRLFTQQMWVAAAFVGVVLLSVAVAIINWMPASTQVADKLVHFAPKTLATIPANDTAQHDNRLLAKADTESPKMIASANANDGRNSDATPNTKKQRNEQKEVIAILPPQSVTQTAQSSTPSVAQNPVAAAPPLADLNIPPYKDNNRNGVDDTYENSPKADKATAAAPTAPRKAAKTAEKPAITKRPIELPSVTNITNAPAQLAQIANVNDFAWLVGNWHDNAAKTNLYEQWSREGQFALSGNAYALGEKGDTTQLESLKIQQEGNSIALYVPIDNSQKLQRYQLIAQQPTKWTFENTTLAFPQQIVLTRNDRATFELTMQNNAPTNSLRKEQASYLRKRNNLQQMRTSRTLEKIAK